MGQPGTREIQRSRPCGYAVGAGADPSSGHIEQPSVDSIAEFFAGTAKWSVVEFVPKTDSQVQRLLSTRKDIFDRYTVEGFEEAFNTFSPWSKRNRSAAVNDVIIC
jgi:hypothetical protein